MALLNLQGGTSGMPAVPGVAQATQPVGQQTKSPANNIKPQPNTTPTPAPIDLSSKYANVGGTIYNTQTQQKFSNPADFFKDSGQNSFNNLKFNTSYSPTGKEGIYGQAVTPTLPQLAQNNTTSTNPTSSIIPPTNTSTPATPYTPPNQGTTGVSQGGLIGNLNANALNNPQYQAATETYNKDKASLTSLDTDYGNQNNDILSRPEGLTQQTGQQGMLQQLYAAKRGALASQLQSDTALLNAANTSQANTTSGLSAAASANAPITGVPYGTQTIQPSQPNGSTTSGAANLSSLVGQRMGADGKTTEFYNTQTGQGFSTPQALADFVNQQMPGTNATAQNVFQVLQQQNSGQQNGGALNPLNQVSSIAQQVISGQISPSQAYSMGGSVSNWQTLLNQALQQSQPGFDQSAAQAKYDANQSAQGAQGQQKAAFQSAYQQGQGLQNQLISLIQSKGINSNDINGLNIFFQGIANNTSSSDYKQFENLLTDVISTYSQILTPGSTTDTARAKADSLLDGSASGQSIIDTIKSLDQQAQSKINGVQTPSTVGNKTSTNSTTIPSGSLSF